MCIHYFLHQYNTHFRINHTRYFSCSCTCINILKIQNHNKYLRRAYCIKDLKVFSFSPNSLLLDIVFIKKLTNLCLLDITFVKLLSKLSLLENMDFICNLYLRLLWVFIKMNLHFKFNSKESNLLKQSFVFINWFWTIKKVTI